MARAETYYVCQSCGAVHAKWAGHQINQPVFIRPSKSMSQIGG